MLMLAMPRIHLECFLWMRSLNVRVALHCSDSWLEMIHLVGALLVPCFLRNLDSGVLSDVLILIFRTVDLGNPQLSMHSCRETGGSKDVEAAVKLFKTFFEDFGSVEQYVYAAELKL